MIIIIDVVIIIIIFNYLIFLLISPPNIEHFKINILKTEFRLNTILTFSL